MVAALGGRGTPVMMTPRNSGPNSLDADANVESSTVDDENRKMSVTSWRKAVPKRAATAGGLPESMPAYSASGTLRVVGVEKVHRALMSSH